MTESLLKQLAEALLSSTGCEMKGLYMGYVGYTTESSHGPTRSHLWGSSQSGCLAIVLSAPAIASTTTHPLPGHLSFQNPYLVSCLRRLKGFSPEWSPVGDFLLSDIPLSFFQDFKTIYLRCPLLTSPSLSLNSFICVNSKCLKKIISPRYIRHTYFFYCLNTNILWFSPACLSA